MKTLYLEVEIRLSTNLTLVLESICSSSLFKGTILNESSMSEALLLITAMKVSIEEAVTRW